jgi:hypothetical protein
MYPKVDESFTPALQRLAAVFAMAVALAACSRDLPAQATRAAPPASLMRLRRLRRPWCAHSRTSRSSSIAMVRRW